MLHSCLFLALSGTDASVLAPLVRFAAVGIAVGLVGGLPLGIIANRSGALGGYGSLRRRALRLGHVATIMLPLMAGFYALAGTTWGVSQALARWAVPLWISGACLLEAVLIGTAWRPRIRYLLPLPATALTAAALLFAMALNPALA
jgi:hypothetical protein